MIPVRAPTHTTMWVRIPAAQSERSRSKPMKLPRAALRTRRIAISQSGNVESTPAISKLCRWGRRLPGTAFQKPLELANDPAASNRFSGLTFQKDVSELEAALATRPRIAMLWKEQRFAALARRQRATGVAPNGDAEHGT